MQKFILRSTYNLYGKRCNPFIAADGIVFNDGQTLLKLRANAKDTKIEIYNTLDCMKRVCCDDTLIMESGEVINLIGPAKSIGDCIIFKDLTTVFKEKEINAPIIIYKSFDDFKKYVTHTNYDVHYIQDDDIVYEIKTRSSNEHLIKLDPTKIRTI